MQGVSLRCCCSVFCPIEPELLEIDSSNYESAPPPIVEHVVGCCVWIFSLRREFVHGECNRKHFRPCFSLQLSHTPYALLALLAAIDRQWKASFAADLERNADVVQAHLHATPALTFVVRQIYEAYGDALLDDDVLEDPTALVDFNNLIAFLAEDYPGALPEPARTQLQKALEELQRLAAASLVSAVLPQAQVLANAVRTIAEYVSPRTASGERVILLDFPVGNTIPTRVVEKILIREGIRVEVVRVALTRNDSRSRGVTRKEILEARLAERGVQAADTVVLLDEWLSGANFRNVVELLGRISAIGDATFLPVGLLTETSSADERFASHVAEHDRVVGRLGEPAGAATTQ